MAHQFRGSKYPIPAKTAAKSAVKSAAPPKPSKRHKLLYTILPLLLAVGILPVLVLGLYLLGVYRETLAKYEQRLQIEKVESSARQIELYISKYRGQSMGLARALELNGGFSGMRNGG